jgi:fructosamine-3-kinase
MLDAVSQAIGRASGRPFALRSSHGVAGGCIHRAMILEGEGGRFFVKLNSAANLDMFEAEADGLRALAASGAIRVPAVVAVGAGGNESFLVLEALDLGGRGSWAEMGRSLARLHSGIGERFGWHRDNYIGATRQENGETGDWPSFYRRYRLGYQLALALQNGHGRRLYERGMALGERIEGFFAAYRPQASLLHGDLWSGNVSFLNDGTPVIFDPAVYRGDPEADLAMTELFGGFPRDFHAAYAEVRPIDSGYAVRKTLYNLYHVLNHANLFGGGYASQAQGMIDRLLAHLGH